MTVRTVYVGASADLVRGFVTSPLERSIAASDGIDYIESQSDQGISTINVRLKLNFNAADALADISARVNQVRGDLPPKAEVPSINIEPSDSVFAAMRAGARGYLVKGASQQEISRAISAVAAGEAIFGPGVARRVLRFFASPPAAAEPAFPELSPREREVLNLIAGGLTNTAIAGRLGLSTKTVGNHTSAIFAKLQVAGRAEAIIRAREAGFGR